MEKWSNRWGYAGCYSPVSRTVRDAAACMGWWSAAEPLGRTSCALCCCHNHISDETYVKLCDLSFLFLTHSFIYCSLTSTQNTFDSNLNPFLYYTKISVCTCVLHFTLRTLSWHRWMVLHRSSSPLSSKDWLRICSNVYTALSICCQ